MSLIATIKSILGMGDSNRAEDGTTVTVEREPDGSGAAVERTTDESATVSETDETDELGSEAGGAASSDDAVEPAEEQQVEAADEGDQTGDPVDTISGIGPAYAERLADAGIETVDDLADADAVAVAEETDIAESRVRDWIDRAGDD